MNKITIGLIQIKPQNSQKDNLAKAIRLIQNARKRGAQIICLPELFKSVYFPQTKTRKNFELAERIPGPSSRLFMDLARKLKAVLIVPLFEQAQNKNYYNSLVVIDSDGSTVGKYRKTHLPNDPCFYEKFYFQKGDLGFKIFETAYGKIGTLICWDQWFPEAARKLALMGAQIIFYPSAIGWHDCQTLTERKKEQVAWEMVQRSHAIANGVFVASVNRIGREGKLNFWGNSFVSGPFGELLAKASSNKEEILIVNCDLDQISRVRKYWPFLKEKAK